MLEIEKKIREAADNYAEKHNYIKIRDAFIIAVKSPEAKEYWQQKLGEELSAIINQDGDEVSDGECIDQIIEYLLKNDIYVDRR